MRQLWAKRAQMEKTSTSPVPYPKVFRAVKAEEMAQPGGGTGMHRGRTLTLTPTLILTLTLTLTLTLALTLTRRTRGPARRECAQL